MNWVTSLILLAAIGGAHLQCFSPNDDFKVATYSTDLSGITDFGLKLYKELSSGTTPKNFFFSPYSIWTALTLSYFGSAGNTQRQLESVLNVSGKVSTIKLWKALERMYEMRSLNTTLYTFNVANQAYFDDSLSLTPCIKKILHKELRVVDFFDTVKAAGEINGLVDKTTKGRISEVVTPPDLLDALMVLVNAAFFKGTWKYQFKPSNTRPRDFFITRDDSAPLNMMSQKGIFKHGVSSQLGAQVLELPYSGDEMSMYVLLPTGEAPDRFERMVSNLNGASLNDAIASKNMQRQTVDVQLPKFKFTMQLADELEGALKNMGIVDLFDGNLSNLTGFERFQVLTIDRTIHKAFIEVNEEGTEAAAVTALIAFTRSSLPREPDVVRFYCNQPFIFFIHDNKTRNVLFLGAVRNPRG